MNDQSDKEEIRLTEAELVAILDEIGKMLNEAPETITNGTRFGRDFILGAQVCLVAVAAKCAVAFGNSPEEVLSVIKKGEAAHQHPDPTDGVMGTTASQSMKIKSKSNRRLN